MRAGKIVCQRIEDPPFLNMDLVVESMPVVRSQATESQ